MNRSKIQAATLILAALFIIILFPGTRANADIVDSGICGNNITWALDSEGILTIQGSGKMKNWNIISSDHSPWYKCADVKTVVIGKGVTSIGNGAFAWCEKLESITIPDSITSIGNYAFYFCSGLKEITIPDNVTSIGNRAFYGCSGLKEITIPDNVTSIGEYAFYGWSELKEITIPDSITSIDEGTFAFCKNLKSITIPDSVTSIGNRAFYGCSGLKEITIPDSVTSIGEYAFNDCSSLKKIVFPDKESYAFNQSCFARCTSIETVIVNSEAELDSVVFSDCPSSFEFYYYYDVIYSAENGTVEGKSRSYAGDILELDITPDENYIVDKVTLNGNEILSDENCKYICTMPDSEDSVTIEATFMPGGKCGENVTWKFDSEGTLTISGNGKMEDYDKDLYSTTTAPWSTFQYSVESVVIEDGVTYIGKYAFSKMGIKEATIPGSVKAIGYAAFTSAGLGKITIQEGVEWIDSQAFTGCYFEELVIPNSVYHIGDYAFYICGNIKEIIIPDNVTRLNMATFSSCNNLAKVIIPDNPDFQIHFNAFSNCGKLESIVINSEAKKKIQRLLRMSLKTSFITITAYNTPPKTDQSRANPVPMEAIVWNWMLLLTRTI